MNIKPHLSIQVDNNKEEGHSYKREKTFLYKVYFQFENGTEIPLEFSVRFIETRKGGFVKRRTHWVNSEQYSNLAKQERAILDAEIRKFVNPDRGEIHHIDSSKEEFESPNNDSFFGEFLTGTSW